MEQPGRDGKRPGSALTSAVVLAFAAAGLLSKRAPAMQSEHARPRSQTVGSSGASARSETTALPVAHPGGFLGVARSVFDRIGRDNITLVAAGIAFYVMLAIFPALAMLVSLYALVGNPADVAARIQDYGSLVPPESLKLITDGLNGFAQKSTSQLSLALLVSILLALWSARAGISAIMTGLNIAYEEIEKRSFIMQNLIALGLTLAGVVFAILVFVAVPVVPIVISVLHIDGWAAAVVDLSRWPVLALVVAGGLAFIYRYAPSRSHPRWRWISWGSGIATICWIIGSIVFSVYVSRFGSYDATYGSLGAVVVLLLWFWVSALVLLLGAEIDSELDTRASATSSPLGAAPPSAGPPGKRIIAPVR